MGKQAITAGAAQVRAYRLAAHHLARPLPAGAFAQAAGVCGVQNSPPGAFETALWNRVRPGAPAGMQAALYEEKTLLQAWSYRGAPVVFPTQESDIFLAPLCAEPGEEPWIYTRGITLALDALGLTFGELLPLVAAAVRGLGDREVESKEALDQILADAIAPALPAEKRAIWAQPSPYGRPDRQTLGGAAVSFLLRPCAFGGEIVFGRRAGQSPTFATYRHWLGRDFAPRPDAARRLARKFLHAYGPATVRDFAAWLGSSPAQAKRLWGLAGEKVRISVDGRAGEMLPEDLPALQRAEFGPRRWILLGPHDPYLDARDHATLLPDAAKQRLVWRTVANPGAILCDGRIVGIWKVKTAAQGLDVTVQPFEPLPPAALQTMQAEAEAYAAFRQKTLRGWKVEEP